MRQTRLNLGCSTTLLEGYIGVDAWTPPWATDENFLKADLRHSWPWADGTVDEIRAWDIVEHLPDPIHTMNEIWRVLKPGGYVEIVVPTTDGPGAWQDPTHVSYWNANSFLYRTAGDAHYERFKDAYGMKGAFEVRDKSLGKDSYGVIKLTIKLEKKEEEGKEKDTGMEAITDVTKGKQAIFSVVHATARPEKWKEIYDAWLKEATWPELVEYVLVIDSRWGFDLGQAAVARDYMRSMDRIVLNTGRRCYVDAVNEGAKYATGMMIVVNADDQYPAKDWDEALGNLPLTGVDKSCPPVDYVIEVTTGTPNEHERGIMVMPILTRHRYERLGYVFYPQYESMYADNDFCAMARRDKCVADGRALVFPHKHPICDKSVKRDEQYAAQNRPEAYELGKKIFEARVKNGFGEVEVEETPKPKLELVKGKRPLFSLCHTTARVPDGWREAAKAWKERCDRPEDVEYILTVDEPLDVQEGHFPVTKLGVCNGTKKDCVSGWNYAAQLSEGRFIITVADDLFPPEHWDTELKKVIDFEKEEVLEVSTGAHDGVLTFCMMTREYYAKYGYVLYPEFVSAYADNDFTDQARRDGVVKDAKHLMFEHRHPTITGELPDKVYLHQGSDHAYDVGKSTYTKRTEARGKTVKKKVAVCVPGERFSAAWVNCWTFLIAYLMAKFDLSVYMAYTSNVFVTRQVLLESVMAGRPAADYVLWIDDDNLVSTEQLGMLIEDLEQNPGVDVVAGWTWIAGDVYSRADGEKERVSVGTFHPEHGGCVYLREEQMKSSTSDLIDIDWTGFPVVLMRYSVLVKAGRYPFLPIFSDLHAYGMSGEDTAFCKNVKDRGGCRIVVDRRVKVPHLKLRSAEPLLMPSVAQSQAV